MNNSSRLPRYLLFGKLPVVAVEPWPSSPLIDDRDFPDEREKKTHTRQLQIIRIDSVIAWTEVQLRLMRSTDV